MSIDPQSVGEAREKADGARARFRASLGAAQRRIAPARLKEDALIAVTDSVDHARQAAIDTVRQRPVVSAAIGGTLAALILWRPARALWHGGQTVTQAAFHHIEKWRRADGETAQDSEAQSHNHPVGHNQGQTD